MRHVLPLFAVFLSGSLSVCMICVMNLFGLRMASPVFCPENKKPVVSTTGRHGRGTTRIHPQGCSLFSVTRSTSGTTSFEPEAQGLLRDHRTAGFSASPAFCEPSRSLLLPVSALHNSNTSLFPCQHGPLRGNGTARDLRYADPGRIVSVVSRLRDIIFPGSCSAKISFLRRAVS